MKFFLLINVNMLKIVGNSTFMLINVKMPMTVHVKMPTTFGILTFMSRKNSITLGPDWIAPSNRNGLFWPIL